MRTRRSNLAALAALLLGGLVSSVAWALHAGTLSLATGRAEGAGPSGAAEWFLDEVVEELGLSQEQQAIVERIREESAARIERLETALRSTGSAVRAAEEAPVFDEATAGNLIRQQAEIAAYLWGTRTRTASEVYRVLTPAQRDEFHELRSQKEGLPLDDTPSISGGLGRP